ncbi:23168_t:CDS:1 [Cetraspora pellucida]|uniref:23168_t:CDS:1 n=1 Tax=Cetraspora pellucida TaxID=1433469 RepID=A0A9N9C3Q9_9GLOM|nr:23168_t:CDS:1 [Cetraspora pellucida]
MGGKENEKEEFSPEINLLDPNKPYFYSEDEQITGVSVKPPYPPEIKAGDLVRDLLSKYETKSPKMLNEFFIYRKAFVQAFKKQKLKPKMTQVSSLASTSWHSESTDVKNAYRKIAREAEQLYINERKKRQQSKTTDKMQTSDSEVTSTPISSGSNYPVVSNPSHRTVVSVQPGSFISIKSPTHTNLQFLDTNASSAFNGSYEQTCPTSFEDATDYYSELTTEPMYTQDQQPIMHHGTSIQTTNANFNLRYQSIYSGNPLPTEGYYTFNTKNTSYNSNTSGTQYPYSQTSTQSLSSHNMLDYSNGGGPLGRPPVNENK